MNIVRLYSSTLLKNLKNFFLPYKSEYNIGRSFLLSMKEKN